MMIKYGKLNLYGQRVDGGNILESSLGNRYTMEAFKTLSLKFEYHSCYMSPYEAH